MTTENAAEAAWQALQPRAQSAGVLDVYRTGNIDVTGNVLWGFNEGYAAGRASLAPLLQQVAETVREEAAKKCEDSAVVNRDRAMTEVFDTAHSCRLDRRDEDDELARAIRALNIAAIASQVLAQEGKV